LKGSNAPCQKANNLILALRDAFNQERPGGVDGKDYRET